MKKHVTVSVFFCALFLFDVREQILNVNFQTYVHVEKHVFFDYNPLIPYVKSPGSLFYSHDFCFVFAVADWSSPHRENTKVRHDLLHTVIQVNICATFCGPGSVADLGPG